MAYESNSTWASSCSEGRRYFLGFKFSRSYRAALFLGPVSSMDGAHPSQWLFPSGSHIKVNCDVGFISSDFYQMAAVARSAEGVWVWWRVSKLVGQPPAA